MSNDFREGVIVFFRVMGKDDTMARSIHPTGRWIEHSAEDYIIRGPEDELLGIYPRDFVSAILPLQTVGPGAQTNANNPSFKPQG